MTAVEARKRAEEVKQRSINEQTADLMDEIDVAVRRGEMSTTYYKPLTQEVIDYLEKEPNLFKINMQTDYRDGNYYEISW